MPDKQSETRQCPFCKEEVNAAAVRCKHCLAAIQPARPGHGGVCPFCKEEINAEATRCPHCTADLVPGVRRLRRVPRRQVSAPTKFISRGVRPRQTLRPRSANRPISTDPDCADYDIDDEGTWTFIGSDEDNCYYELTDPVSHYGVFE